MSIDSATGVWSQLATVDANVNSFKIGCHPPANNFYVVRAYNSFGDSAYSNAACAQCVYPDADPGDTPPTINITSPANGDVVDHNFAITGNAFDVDGNGTIAKVEFFANGSKVGEVTDPPYVFSWNNAPLGAYSVVKASATITLGNLSQTYDGTAKPITATTNPAGLSGVSITYHGSATVPTNGGSYSIVASLANDNYTAADANGTLTIGKASQTTTFDQPANKTYGDAPFAVTASCSSGLPVGFSIASGPATISGTTVTLNGAGTVIVRASQSGNENYNAAANVDRSFIAGRQ